jgi:hypothetical protein
VAVQRIEEAVRALQEALASPPRLQQSWRHIVQERLAVVNDELTAERTVAADTWLSARAHHLRRERTRLLSRLRVLGAMVVESPDVEAVRQSLVRLVQDIEHHHQRVNDLVYDAVGLDMGGSE